MLKQRIRQGETHYKTIRSVQKLLRTQKQPMEQCKIQEVEDLSEVGDISSIYSKFKGIKKGCTYFL